MKWISVRKALPEEWEYVLVCTTSEDKNPLTKRSIFIAHRRKGWGKKIRWWPVHGVKFRYVRITHWMPLPEFPKSRNNNAINRQDS